jgi:methyltransferase (TIGR00027 family)
VKPQQASTTAKLIAASMVLLGSDARRRDLVAPDAAMLSAFFLAGTASATRTDRWLAASARRPLTRRAWNALERCVLPGIVEHFGLRKRWIEQRCRAAISGGVERVIVLGAGFDTLGCRLCLEMDMVEVIEIDHPATQARKREAIDALTPRLKAPLHFIACDLATQQLPAALMNDPRRTLVIAEGLLMYLGAEAVGRLFDALHALSPAGDVQLVFSHLVRWPDGRTGFRPCSRLVDAWLAWRGEPFTWAIEPQALPALLSRHRFALIESATPAGPFQGEDLVSCRTL